MVSKKRGLIKNQPSEAFKSPPSLASVTADKRSIIIDLGNLCCQFKSDGAA